MLDALFCRRVARRLRANRLSLWLGDLAEYLEGLAYPVPTVQHYVRCAEHLIHWLGKDADDPPRIDEDVIESFLTGHLPSCACPPPAPRQLFMVRAALNHLLVALRGRGRIGPPPSPPRTAVGEVLDLYEKHLVDVCGVAVATRTYRLRYADEFLHAQYGHGPLELASLGPPALLEFIAKRATGVRPGTISVIASSLRSLLRFLACRGLCDRRLAAAVPSVPQWRLAAVPKTIPVAEVNRLVLSFDRLAATGCRDQAIALCFVELGLRTQEVAGLTLDDIDWRRGTLRIVSGKARREHVLPLPARLGSAIAAYLRRGRPASGHRDLFLRHRAPVGAPVTRELVRGVIRRAYVRCGIAPPADGPHVLRHTLATRMIAGGAQLQEVAGILGHQSLDTTGIYAKVNLPLLAQVALPWPEAR